MDWHDGCLRDAVILPGFDILHRRRGDARGKDNFPVDLLATVFYFRGDRAYMVDSR
ncbi:hypothetical protein D3C86_2160150 [compost metagenome]